MEVWLAERCIPRFVPRESWMIVNGEGFASSVSCPKQCAGPSGVTLHAVCAPCQAAAETRLQ